MKGPSSAPAGIHSYLSLRAEHRKNCALTGLKASAEAPTPDQGVQG